MSYREVSNKIVQCRKRQRCQWCGEAIEPGDTALYRVYTMDGHFHRDHTHSECTEAMNSLPQWEADEGWAMWSFRRGSTEYA